MFALKLKKKLNETTSELDDIKKEKATLEKILIANNLNFNNIDIDVGQDSKLDNENANNNNGEKVHQEELQKKIMNLNKELEVANEWKVEISKLKGNFCYL